MRRLFVLSSGLAVASLAFAACGSGGDDDDPTTVPSQAPASKDLSPQEIVEKYKASVVNIIATYPQGGGGGSGIVWEDSTHILTNAHVVLGAGSIKVVDPTDNKQINARVVAMSPCDDLALLSVDRGNFVPAPIGDSKKLQTGEDVVVLGYPGTATDPAGNKLAVTRGIVSKLGDAYDGLEDLIQTDAAINPGNSGGPMVNKRGEVVGVNSLGDTQRQSVNWAISVAEARFVADKLKAGKNIDYLGVRIEQNYAGLAKQLNIKLAYTDGLLVTGVDTGSPAYKAGFGYSDLIYSIDGVSVDSKGELCDVLRSRKPGDKIEIDMVRTYTDGTFKEFYPEVELQ